MQYDEARGVIVRQPGHVDSMASDVSILSMLGAEDARVDAEAVVIRGGSEAVSEVASEAVRRCLDVEPVSDDRQEVDLGKLTSKQREALETAYHEGLFEQPRGADLSDLAGELGKQKSTVGDLIKRAEGAVFSQLFGGDEDA